MTKLTKNEKILRKASKKWEKFLAEGAFKGQTNEAGDPDQYYNDMPTSSDYKYSAADDFKKGDKIKVRSVKKGYATGGIEPEPDDVRCQTGKVKGFDGGRLIVALDNGKTVSINGRNASKLEHQWDNEIMFSCPDQVSEARMGEYGKMDAEQGLPPTKIGRGNEEYMAAYNAVLQARGEKPLDIQKPDQAYLDALRSGQLEENEKKKFKVGEFVRIVGGSLKGATGKILEPVTTMKGEEGFAIELYSDAKMKVFGQRGDEVIATADDMESGGTTDGMELYDIDEKAIAEKNCGCGQDPCITYGKKNLKEEIIEDFAIELEDGVTFADVEEAGLVTPGVDSVIDNGDGFAQVYAEPKAMMEMAKALQAMTGVMVSPQSHGAVDEEMSKKDFVRMVRDKGKVPNLKGDMGPLPGLEGPFQYRSGAVLYYDPKAGKYYDRGKDMYLDDQEAADLTMESNPSSFATRVTHSSDPEMDQVMDIAADMLELSARSRIPVSLVGVESALQKQGFDTEMEKEMLIVDNKYVIAKIEALPKTAQKISFTKYAADYLANLPGEQQDLPLG